MRVCTTSLYCWYGICHSCSKEGLSAATTLVSKYKQLPLYSMRWLLLVLQLVDQIALHVNILLIRCTDYILRKTASPQTIAKIYVRYIILIFHPKKCTMYIVCVLQTKLNTKKGTNFCNISFASWLLQQPLLNSHTNDWYMMAVLPLMIKQIKVW